MSVAQHNAFRGCSNYVDASDRNLGSLEALVTFLEKTQPFVDKYDFQDELQAGCFVPEFNHLRRRPELLNLQDMKRQALTVSTVETPWDVSQERSFSAII